MGGDVLAQWTESSRSTAVALVGGSGIRDANPRFHQLDGGGEAWRWLNGPHAKVRYGTLSELVRAEAATLAPVPYLSRFDIRERCTDWYAGELGLALEDGQRRVRPALILDNLNVYLGQLPKELAGQMSLCTNSGRGEQDWRCGIAGHIAQFSRKRRQERHAEIEQREEHAHADRSVLRRQFARQQAEGWACRQ